MLTLPPSLKAQQTRTLTTMVSSGSDSGSISVAVISNGRTSEFSDCTNGCTETVDSTLTLLATHSAGWGTHSGDWNITGTSVSVSSSISNSCLDSCTFIMPNNDVTVSVTFTQDEAFGHGCRSQILGRLSLSSDGGVLK